MGAGMPVLAHYPDHRGALDGKGKMTAPRRDIMMAPDQSSIGKCEGKAVRHSASGQVEQAFHIACYLQPAAIHRFRSEEHTSELQSLMRISYAVFCLKKKTTHQAERTQIYTAKK